MSKPIDKKIETMKEAISWFRKQIEPHDCGWMYTTIDGLKHRIKVLRKEIKKININYGKELIWK